MPTDESSDICIEPMGKIGHGGYILERFIGDEIPRHTHI